MSVNTAHANNGVLIHAGEYILLHSDSVSMDFVGQDNPVFKGSKQGRIYLTSHRMIFNNKKSGDPMQSFSAPFIALSDVELEQPVFGANYIKGKVRAQPNGNFVGEVKFKLYFKAGGAIEYGQALLRAASTAQQNMHNGNFADDPPPYTPSGAWHEAPPPAYQPPPGYYGWLPTHDAFSGPAPNTVYISDNPPPYPGIGAPPAYTAQPQSGPPPSTGLGCPPSAVSWNGFSLPPDTCPQPLQNQPPAGGWASAYPPPPYGVPMNYGQGGPHMQPCDPPGYGMQPCAPPGGTMAPHPTHVHNPPPSQPGPYQQNLSHGASRPNPYPGAQGASGFNAPPPGHAKEVEARATANPNECCQPPPPHDLPPSYNDVPPSFNDSPRDRNK